MECGTDVASQEGCPGFPLHCRLSERQCEINQGSVQGICEAGTKEWIEVSREILGGSIYDE